MIDNISVISDIVLVRPIEIEQSKTIVVPGSGKAQYGEVVKCGPGRRSKKTGKVLPINVHVGDKVVYGDNTGEKFFLNFGENTHVLRESDIMAVVE